MSNSPNLTAIGKALTFPALPTLETIDPLRGCTEQLRVSMLTFLGGGGGCSEAIEAGQLGKP